MERDRVSAALWVLIVVALSVVALAAYCAGYFLLDETGSRVLPANTNRVRVYQSEWMVWTFTPAAKIESLLTGNDVDMELQ